VLQLPTVSDQWRRKIPALKWKVHDVLTLQRSEQGCYHRQFKQHRSSHLHSAELATNSNSRDSFVNIVAVTAVSIILM